MDLKQCSVKEAGLESLTKKKMKFLALIKRVLSLYFLFAFLHNYKDQPNVSLYFNYVRHNLVTLNPFAGSVKVTNHTEL